MRKAFILLVAALLVLSSIEVPTRFNQLSYNIVYHGKNVEKALETITDVDGEILSARNNAFIGVFKQTGSASSWDYRTSVSYTVNTSLLESIGDYVYSWGDNKGWFLIVVNNSGLGYLHIFNASGSAVSSFVAPNQVLEGIVFGDYIGSDGLSEFVFATYKTKIISINLAFRDSSPYPNSFNSIGQLQLQIDNNDSCIYGIKADNDTVPEIAVVLYNGTIDIIDIYENNTGFAIRDKVDTDSNLIKKELHISDFDNDGLDEILAYSRNNSATTIYYIDNTINGYKVLGKWVINSASTYLAAGDFNGDSKLDIGFSYMTDSVNVNVTYITYTGSRIFSSLYNLSKSNAIGNYLRNAYSVDIDRNGIDDFLLYYRTVDAALQTTYRFYGVINSGAYSKLYKLFDNPVSSVVSDYNLDNYGEILIYQSNTSGNFLEIYGNNFTSKSTLSYDNITGTLSKTIRIDGYYEKFVFYNDTEKKILILRKSVTVFNAHITTPQVNGLVILDSPNINVSWVINIEGESRGTRLGYNSTIVYTRATALNDSYEINLPSQGLYKIVLGFDIVDIGSIEMYFYVVYDTEKPILIEFTPLNNTYTKLENITFTWNISDNVRFESISVYDNSTLLFRNDSHLGNITKNLQVGLHKITVQITDIAKNNATYKFVLTIDINPPTIFRIEPNATTVYTSASVLLKWSASDDNGLSKFEIKDNDTVIKTLSGYSRSDNLTFAVEGIHFIEVIAFDYAGNTASFLLKVIVDKTEPSVILLSPGNNSLTGGDVALTFQVNDSNFYKAVFYINETMLGVFYNTGITSVPVKFNRSGTYIIKLEALDLAMNRRIVKVVLHADVDPVIFDVVEPPNNSYTNNSTLSLVVQYQNVDDFEKLVISINGTQVISSTNPNETQFGLSIYQGLNVINLTSIDAVGNRYSLKIYITLDVENPSITVYYERYTRSNPTILNITVSDNTGIAELVVKSPLSVKTILNPPPALIVNLDLVYGNNTLVIVVKDLAGNQLEIEIWVVYDSKPPEITILSPSNGTVTRESKIELKMNITDEWMSVVDIKVLVNNELYSENRADLNITLQIDGVYIVEIVAYDSLGNKGEKTLIIVKDTQSPVINVHNPANGSLINDTLILEMSIIDDNPDNTTIVVEGETLWVNKTEIDVVLKLKTEGVKKVIITAYDRAGNYETVVLIVTCDQTPPEITVSASKKEVSVGEIVRFSINVSDNYGVKAIEIYVNGDYKGSLIQNFRSYETTFSVEGEYAIIFKALDLVGNSKTFVVVIKVIGGTGQSSIDIEFLAVVVVPLSILTGLVIGYIKTRRMS